MSKKIKDEQKKFLGETLNQYDKALNEGIDQLDKKNREQNHKISSLVNSFDNEYLEKDVEGNMTTLENSKDGMVIINEIQGSTEVNYCKDGEKELTLNGDIDTQGESFVTITEGVDGGLVDVALEGNTLVNVSKTKDSTAISKAYTVENSGNHVALQGEYDGKCRPVVTGNTLVNLSINPTNNGFINNKYATVGRTVYNLKPSTLYTYIITNNSSALVQLYLNNTQCFPYKRVDVEANSTAIGTATTLGTISGNIWISLQEAETVEQNLKLILLEGDYTNKPIPEYFTGLQSSFEDKVVTQEMVDAGEELADNLGKYRIDYKSIQEDGTVGSTKTLYLNSPLLEEDTIEEKDNGIYHVHRYSEVVLDGSADEKWGTNGNIENTYFKYMCNSKTDAKSSASTSICDKLPTVSASSLTNGILVNTGTGKIQIICDASTLSKFNQWLQQNPITVVYELASPTYELIEQSNLVIPSYTNGHLDFNTAVPVEKVEFKPFSEELTYLYPSTSYTVQFKSDKAIAIDITLGGTELLAQNIVVGLNRISITTPETLTDNKLIISGIGANISEVVVTDTDKEFRYFEGMKSVGECEGNIIEILSRNSKNLTDIIPSNWEVGSIDGVDGQNIVSTKRIRTKSFMLLPKKQGYLNHKRFGNYKLAIRFYDKDYKMIDGTNKPYQGFISQDKISIPDGAFYYKLVCASIEEVNILPNEIVNNQCYLGTEKTPTSYIKPKQNTQQLTHEPLRAVEDVKDRYVLIDGKWYIERNTYVCKITKDTVVFAQANTFENYEIFGINTANSSSHPTNKKPLCDKFLTQPANWNNLHHEEIECVQTYDNDRIFIKILSSRLPKVSDYATNNFKEWLINNEFSVIYQSASPVYEEINYNPFETYADITHVSANSLIPTNVVVKNHGYNCILKPSTKYTIALNKPNGTISAKLGGSAKVDSTNSIFTITTPSTLNDNILRLSGSGNVKDIMILEGDKTVNTPSYFEGIESVFEQEYDVKKGKYRVTARVEVDGKESSIVFYINEPLRGTGIAKDRVFIQDSKVVVERNCGSITYYGDDREGWDAQESKGNNIKFGTQIKNAKAYETYMHPIKCNNFKTYPIPFNERLHETAIVYNHNNLLREIRISINKSKLRTLDINGFKQWLSENPTTVVYQLEEPTYEEADCDLSKLVLENYENSSLIFESNIPVSANIRYSGEVPVVTQAKTLSSQVDNTTLDINENIIPYMCDIDYRIVELQLMNGDTQGEGIELLGIGDIEILGNENVLFNNREDKKHNFSYDMLKRDILSQRYSREEYQYRLDRYLLANKISDEEYKELEGLLNNGE